MSRWFVYIPIIEYILLYCLKKKKTSLTHHDPIVTANIVLDLKDTPIHQIILVPQPLYVLYIKYVTC